MNSIIKIGLTHLNFNDQLWTIFAVLGIFIAFTACESSVISNDDDEIIEESSFPYLMVVNQNTNSVLIIAVGLVGYEFNNLSIDADESQTFDLDDEMPGGYSNINIIVSYRRAGQISSMSIKKNFSDGDTTTVRMRGCISFEGCNGFYLE